MKRKATAFPLCESHFVLVNWQLFIYVFIEMYFFITSLGRMGTFVLWICSVSVDLLITLVELHQLMTSLCHLSWCRRVVLRLHFMAWDPSEMSVYIALFLITRSRCWDLSRILNHGSIYLFYIRIGIMVLSVNLPVRGWSLIHCATDCDMHYN